jgi:hypothetical protein
MHSLTIKLPGELEQAVVEATLREHISKSELVRRALARYLHAPGPEPAAFVSALDQAGDLVGCFTGAPADLASNPAHLADFGQALPRSTRKPVSPDVRRRAGAVRRASRSA